jgi:LAO/AO transport system kinase
MVDGMRDMGVVAAAIRAGDRRALARAITLVESDRADHRAAAIRLTETLADSQVSQKSLRIGLTGTPGVGKSTFIEALGLLLTGTGRRVAVLAVDPSSARTGGSVLGDKTRMERLSRDPNAYIRPSPSKAALGGVARRTREVTLLCEAAGFDIILIETVGVGQSETLVSQIADIFVLLLSPAGGDELQGVKRGIMELADLILVNKCDGDLRAAAQRTVADYAGALRLLRRRADDPEGYPGAMAISAVSGDGLDGAWAAMRNLGEARRGSGALQAHRAAAARMAFESEVREGLVARLLSAPQVSAVLERLGREVEGGRSPDGAAAEALDALGGVT